MTFHNFMLHNITSCDVTSLHWTFYKIASRSSLYVTSHQIMSRHVTSCRISLHRVTSRHLMLRGITSRPITLALYLVHTKYVHAYCNGACSNGQKLFVLFIYSALQCFNQGVVLTSQPLQDDELFEVRLDSKVPKWFGSLDVGVTTVSAANLGFPNTMTSCSQGTTFMLSSNKILNNGKEMTTISKDLDTLSVCTLIKKYIVISLSKLISCSLLASDKTIELLCCKHNNW